MCIQHKKFAHLTQDERFRIEALLEEKYSLRGIARSLNRNVSVITREILRNKRSYGRYCASIAQKTTVKRRQCSKYASRKIENNQELSRIIEENLCGNDSKNGDWSPEVIAQTVLKDKVSHTTIYAWIKRSRKDLKHLLPHQGRRRATYGSIKTRKYREMSLPSIDTRPKEVETRTVSGHYEGDTVVLKEGRLHTLVERKSRFLIAELITMVGPGLAMQIAQSAIHNLKVFPVNCRGTITYDQGSEFAWWDEIEKELTGTKVYFAHAHAPWERGTNERTNGLIRRYFPKGKRTVTVTKQDVSKVVWMLNHRPRKILHWRTPCEVFEKCCTSSLN
jgi:transposase, IS30 family